MELSFPLNNTRSLLIFNTVLYVVKLFVVIVPLVIVPLAIVPDAVRSVILLMLLLFRLTVLLSDIPVLLKLMTDSFNIFVSLIDELFNIS